jgi:alkanesulfonate monooxygenase SsuD/methylene tetrahydromethanopterin reductase-like flavin-dependent oxidoreductase (luciferase family)
MLVDLLLIPFGATYVDMRLAALAAEEAGFHGLWTFDHFREPVRYAGAPVPECWTVLSALAEATSRLQLGPLVLNVANRKPGLLANMAATLQQVSQGRLVLGLGAGGGPNTPYTAEQEMLGQDVLGDALRAEQVVETIQVLRHLWSGEPAEFDGRYFRLRRPAGFLRPEPAPAIVVGGFGARMARLAGRYADGFNLPARLPGGDALIELARRERLGAHHTLDGFEVSAFTGFHPRWLNPGNADRAGLERLGVSRLILQVEAPYPLEAIRAARVAAG